MKWILECLISTFTFVPYTFSPLLSLPLPHSLPPVVWTHICTSFSLCPYFWGWSSLSFHLLLYLVSRTIQQHVKETNSDVSPLTSSLGYTIIIQHNVWECVRMQPSIVALWLVMHLPIRAQILTYPSCYWRYMNGLGAIHIKIWNQQCDAHSGSPHSDEASGLLLFHDLTGKHLINGSEGNNLEKADFKDTFLSTCEVWKPYYPVHLHVTLHSSLFQIKC